MGNGGRAISADLAHRRSVLTIEKATSAPFGQIGTRFGPDCHGLVTNATDSSDRDRSPTLCASGSVVDRMPTASCRG